MKSENAAKTRVCFDLSAAVQQSAGISRFEHSLAKALIAQDGPEPYSFFYTAPTPLAALPLAPGIARLPHKVVITKNKLWRIALLLKHAAFLKSDRQVFPENIIGKPVIFHGMDYIAPPLKAPTVVTVYDLTAVLYPQLHSRYNRMFMRLALPLCAGKAARILTISENTRRDLVNFLGPAYADRIRVTLPGVPDESYFEDLTPQVLNEALADYGLANRSFILSVGSIEPRKNQSRLVEAYTMLLKNRGSRGMPPLVLVCRTGWGGEYERLRAIAGANGLELQTDRSATGQTGQVLLLTRINDEALKALYQAATVVVYPSLYEGFGLPALEALAAGAPLITSNNSSLPEITGSDGEVALLVEPERVEKIAGAVETLLDNPELAGKFKKAGRERARVFTWERTARLTREAYQEIAVE